MKKKKFDLDPTPRALVASCDIFISPTHKRTEGLAPVWGSEFTSKDAALQGGAAETAARLNVKLRDLRGGGGACFVTAES
jgi:hypothetical protein